MREIEANPEERARSLSPLVTKLDPSSNSAENRLIVILLGAAGLCPCLHKHKHPRESIIQCNAVYLV